MKTVSHFIKVPFLLLAVFFLHEQTAAQQVTGVQTPCATAAQGNAGNFIICYTIGEMPLVQGFQNSGLTITQGVLQPITALADSVFECFSKAEVKVFPNPSPGIFLLELAMLQRGRISTQLLDASGKQLQSETFDYSTFIQKKYDINRLAGGTYFLILQFTPADNSKTTRCVYTIQKIK